MVAEKAARRGLASAEFAMGYYVGVGVGGRGPDLGEAPVVREGGATRVPRCGCASLTVQGAR